VVLSLVGVATTAAVEPLTLDDVLRLHFAGVSEDVILSEIIVTDSIFELSVDDILRLREAGISDRLVKFMIDTAQEGSGDDLASSSTDDSPAAGLDAEDGEWVNEIESEGPTTTWFVSLNYSTPSWYWDRFWWDYWYYDCHYYPYSYPAWGPYSWCHDAWPGWYSYRRCWAPAYWGYRCSWYADAGWWGVGGGWHDASFYYAHYDRDFVGHRRALSDVKSKGGSTTPGLPLYADAGLKVNGATKHPVRTGWSGDRVDIKVPGERRDAPIKGVASPDRSGSPVKPIREVRAPAGGGRPVKVRTVHAPTEPASDGSGPKDPTEASEDTRETPAKPPGTKVREVEAPKSPATSPPRVDSPKRVEPAPKRPAESGGRPAPAPKSTKTADPRGSSSPRPSKPTR
jgi:hypothetical protein